MDLLPSTLIGAFAPHYELARRYNNREVSDLENISGRVLHALQGAWTAFDIIRPKFILFHESDDNYTDKFNRIRDHVAWVIDPQRQANIEYDQDLHRLWKYLAICILTLTAIATACAASPSLTGRVWR